MTKIYENILYEFQKNVVNIALKQKKFFLALEPGLGKTLTSLSIAQQKNYKNIIVVCQSSKLDDWALEIQEKLGIETSILRGNKQRDNKILDNFVKGAIISSYQTIWRRNKVLDLLNEDFIIIIDESQYLKSHKTNIGKWGIKASEKVNDLLLLSGTPLNKPNDLFAQMKMLGMEMEYKEFEEKFFIIELQKFPGSRWPTKVIKGYKNLELLFKAFKTQSISIKSDDVLDLPQQNFIDIRIRNEKQGVYDYVKENGVYKDLEIPSGGVKFLRLRELSSGYIEQYKDISDHKKVALKDLLETNKNNFSIFYNFTQELNDIKEVCKELGIKVFEFNGATKNGYDAKGCKDRFVILCQYQSASEGLNLQFLNNQLYYSPPTSFVKYKQSWARIHRIGQDEHCFYYKFKTINSIENKMYRNLDSGKDYDERIFKNEDK